MQSMKKRSPSHRRFIASLPCIITLASNVQAAHIRLNNGGGMGLKPADWYCVPLSVEMHEKQHRIGELRFWYAYGGHERASVLARQIYNVTGDRDAALGFIMEWRYEVLH